MDRPRPYLVPMASEPLLLSPLPRKTLDPLWSSYRSPSQSFDFEDPPSAGRSFWYDVVDTTRGFHEETACNTHAKVLPDWTPAFFRAASNASTSAGPSPALELDSPSRLLRCSSSSLSPGYTSPLQDASSRSEHYLLQSQQSVEKSGEFDKSSSLHNKKVFVGGIPQTVDQGELVKIFSKVAHVKKAWLQMERSVGNAKRHRGFGFVIFSDKQAVDSLLGEDTSRFIRFGSGLQFEVKRAVGKHVGTAITPEKGQRPGTNAKIHMVASPQTVSVSQSASMQSTPVSCLVDASAEFSQVPPFPTFPAASVPERETAKFFSEASTPTWLTVLPEQHTIEQPVMCPATTKNLMDFLVGRRPRDEQELERLLLHAMPDHYDD